MISAGYLNLRRPQGGVDRTSRLCNATLKDGKTANKMLINHSHDDKCHHFISTRSSIHVHIRIHIDINIGVQVSSEGCVPVTAVMATVVMCRVRNPACTAASALGKERYING